MKKVLRLTLLFLGLLAAFIGCAEPSPRPAEGRLELRFGLAKFGDVDPLAVVDKLKAWGFDYAEPSLSQVSALSDAEFETLLVRVRAAGIPVESMNWFVPKEIKLTGPAADPAAIRAYLEKALARADRLGAKIVVFGSGGARAVPDGFPRDKAWAQLRDFVRLYGEVIGRNHFGMTIAIEPLPPTVTNILLTLDETLRLAREANRPRVRTMFDFDNMAVAGDAPDAILRAGDEIVHVHMANTHNGRVFPRDESEDPRYATVFANLRAIGYRGRMSLEANSKDLEADAKAGLAFLKRMYERYR